MARELYEDERTELELVAWLLADESAAWMECWTEPPPPHTRHESGDLIIGRQLDDPRVLWTMDERTGRVTRREGEP